MTMILMETSDSYFELEMEMLIHVSLKDLKRSLYLEIYSIFGNEGASDQQAQSANPINPMTMNVSVSVFRFHPTASIQNRTKY